MLPPEHLRQEPRVDSAHQLAPPGYSTAMMQPGFFDVDDRLNNGACKQGHVHRGEVVRWREHLCRDERWACGGASFSGSREVGVSGLAHRLVARRAAEGYHCTLDHPTCWSNTYSGSGWPISSRSGSSTCPSSTAGPPGPGRWAAAGPVRQYGCESAAPGRHR